VGRYKRQEFYIDKFYIFVVEWEEESLCLYLLFLGLLIDCTSWGCHRPTWVEAYVWELFFISRL